MNPSYSLVDYEGSISSNQSSVESLMEEVIPPMGVECDKATTSQKLPFDRTQPPPKIKDEPIDISSKTEDTAPK
jgi:hypothetical protein